MRLVPLLGDLYLPAEQSGEPRPAVVLVFGGGWCEGDRSQQKVYGLKLASAGFVCLATDYRLSGEARWPAQLTDVMTALGWLSANAAGLGVDPERIAVSGNSSGGHVALMAAASSLGYLDGTTEPRCPIKAVCAFYPPVELYSLAAYSTDGTVEKLLGKQALRGDYEQASPLSLASRPFPPVLLLSGNCDQRVPAGQTIRMYEALRQAGNPVDLHIFAGLGHAFDATRENARLAASLMIDFLHRVMSDARQT